ncbi:hypothetical protein N7492_006878 [Penicillium capsulatum]|uniref:Uncharacterized protein n=1 Tax=Penicillium capsulatum TaxID=69766 RepID=A0A9W9I0Z0_9EURO|nr:hypothetical protein N7492_006878 [Penicillium capsulatum]KAJ6116712.1 hypothetical protein N7512_006437 [Penicillium capsulatum]
MITVLVAATLALPRVGVLVLVLGLGLAGGAVINAPAPGQPLQGDAHVLDLLVVEDLRLAEGLAPDVATRALWTSTAMFPLPATAANLPDAESGPRSGSNGHAPLKLTVTCRGPAPRKVLPKGILKAHRSNPRIQRNVELGREVAVAAGVVAADEAVAAGAVAVEGAGVAKRHLVWGIISVCNSIFCNNSMYDNGMNILDTPEFLAF